jgi:hypothetical protein
MLRALVAVTALAVLLLTYVFNPTAAWILLFSVGTLTLARYVRKRDEEAEKGASEAVDW